MEPPRACPGAPAGVPAACFGSTWLRKARPGGLLMRLLGSELGCIRGGRTVFSGLSFMVSAGEALVVLGPNGVGKSSLLRLVAGLVRRSNGELSLEGGDSELSIGEQAHYLGHQDALK